MNVLKERWLNRSDVTRVYVPCKICGEPTCFSGTQLCNDCYEVTSRLKSFLCCRNAIDFVACTLTEVQIRRAERRDRESRTTVPVSEDSK